MFNFVQTKICGLHWKKEKKKKKKKTKYYGAKYTEGVRCGLRTPR